MSELENSPKLFDSKPYVTDPRYLIPEILGRQANQFLGAPRFVHIDLTDGPIEAYKPAEEEKTDDVLSPGYAEDSDLRFDRWMPYNWKPHNLLGGNGYRHFRTYLAGFPRLMLDDDKPRDCLQIWSNNSDILAHNVAIHLGAISGLFIYSELRTKLQIELDELAFGDVQSRYEIPVLRSKRTGQDYYRDASYEDIERVIKELDEKPVKVVNDYGSDSLSAFRTTSDVHLKTILDQ